MTPAELRRNAALADAQGAHALAERLRARAAHLEEKPSPDVAAMTTTDLEVLAAAVGAELARRGVAATAPRIGTKRRDSCRTGVAEK